MPIGNVSGDFFALKNSAMCASSIAGCGGSSAFGRDQTMRVYFTNVSIATRAAKRLKIVLAIKESEARHATAQVLGYRNWADFERECAQQQPSALDEDCVPAVLAERRVYQAAQLAAAGVDLKGQSPEQVVRDWQPSAARPQVPTSGERTASNPKEAALKFLRLVTFLFERAATPVTPYLPELLEGIRQCADDGLLEATEYIAASLLDGSRSPEPHTGRALLEALAARGRPGAILNLVTCLHKGDGGPKDEKRAADLLEHLTRSGKLDQRTQAYAESRLASMYAIGTGRAPKPLRSLEMWERAATEGDVEAAFNAGLYHEGRGKLGNTEAFDPAKAAKYYRMGATQSHLPSATNLGLLILRRPDLSVEQNEALKWLEFAAEQGDLPALEALDRLRMR
ncbi:sel1 repeat family protein [Paraburkholderia sp. UCT31]|uniref:tetratricopeptide repeat protein n=1 Tax=Paraburkholderia sp. UCT31 TaxID=2615209 RepID=UPI0016567B96|nr:tetratricopeptide repeat protein [Paraburkholderia sp. UCT31]MBC8737303.1 sel1 repeat family protein [Paraburkholderia sp. UCT31]